jgi:hypothetical protein
MSDKPDDEFRAGFRALLDETIHWFHIGPREHVVHIIRECAA